MIAGIGVDLATISRFENQSANMVERILTPNELTVAKYWKNPAQQLAKRWAVKEATAKALGSGFAGIAPNQIGLNHHESGQPYLEITPALQARFDQHSITQAQVSLSHEGDQVIAFVVLEASRSN